MTCCSLLRLRHLYDTVSSLKGYLTPPSAVLLIKNVNFRFTLRKLFVPQIKALGSRAPFGP